jgi:hypothetical protein
MLIEGHGVLVLIQMMILSRTKVKLLEVKAAQLQPSKADGSIADDMQIKRHVEM